MAGVSPFSAVRWVLAGNAATRLLGFVALAALARLVTKETWGAYRVLVSLHLVCNVILPLGLDQLVVREADRRADYARALRAIVQITFLVLALAALVGHPLWIRALDLQQNRSLLLFFPAVLFLQALRWGIRPLLISELAFRRISTGEFLQTMLTMFGGVGLVVVWPRAEALYLAYGAGELAGLWWEWRGRDWKTLPSALRHLPLARRLLRQHRKFCAAFTTDQALNTFSTEAPVLLLAGLLGREQIADFTMAKILVTVPVFLLVGALGRVAFPVMAGQQEEDLKRRALLIVRGAAAFIAPVLLWLVFFAPMAALIVLGPEWSATAPIMRWLALYLVLVAMFSPISSLDVIRDRPDLALYWNIITLAVRSAMLLWGAQYGLLWAIAAFSIGSAVMWVAYGCLMAWLLGSGSRAFLSACLRYVPLWGLLAVLWWLVVHLLGQSWWALLASTMPALLYLSLMRFWDREILGFFGKLAFLGGSPAPPSET